MKIMGVGFSNLGISFHLFQKILNDNHPISIAGSMKGSFSSPCLLIHINFDLLTQKFRNIKISLIDCSQKQELIRVCFEITEPSYIFFDEWMFPKFI